MQTTQAKNQTGGILGLIERVGNKLPDPTTLFVVLAFLVIIISWICSLAGVSAVHPGTGKELTIKELATLVARAVDFTGDIVWDTTKPNGTPRKLIDVEKLHRLGWTHKVEIEDGVRRLYEWYKESLNS